MLSNDQWLSLHLLQGWLYSSPVVLSREIHIALLKINSDLESMIFRFINQKNPSILNAFFK